MREARVHKRTVVCSANANAMMRARAAQSQTYAEWNEGVVVKLIGIGICLGHVL